MSLKAFAVTCDRYYPGIVSYYAAHSSDGAITQALFAIRKVGGRATRGDLNATHIALYDQYAARLSKEGCIDRLLTQAVPA